MQEGPVSVRGSPASKVYADSSPPRALWIGEAFRVGVLCESPSFRNSFSTVLFLSLPQPFQRGSLVFFWFRF